jgi:hypothetical protein
MFPINGMSPEGAYQIGGQMPVHPDVVNEMMRRRRAHQMMLAAQGGGNMPHPNQNALDHANANARFMRAVSSGIPGNQPGMVLPTGQHPLNVSGAPLLAPHQGGGGTGSYSGSTWLANIDPITAYGGAHGALYNAAGTPSVSISDPRVSWGGRDGNYAGGYGGLGG